MIACTKVSADGDPPAGPAVATANMMPSAVTFRPAGTAGAPLRRRDCRGWDSPVTTIHDRTAVAPGREETVTVSVLLRAAGEGDSTAWEEIVRRYHSLVWAKVRAYRLQYADACDAVQMTWLRLAENCHKIHDPERLGGWLATTANRECLHILRRPTHPLYPADTTREPADPAAGPEARVIDAYTAQALRALLDELPPRWRDLLRELFTDQPAPYKKVAATTGIPRGSIGPTRTRALQRLRRLVDEHGLTHSRES